MYCESTMQDTSSISFGKEKRICWKPHLRPCNEEAGNSTTTHRLSKNLKALVHLHVKTVEDNETYKVQRTYTRPLRVAQPLRAPWTCRRSEGSRAPLLNRWSSTWWRRRWELGSRGLSRSHHALLRRCKKRKKKRRVMKCSRVNHSSHLSTICSFGRKGARASDNGDSFSSKQQQINRGRRSHVERRGRSAFGGRLFTQRDVDLCHGGLHQTDFTYRAFGDSIFSGHPDDPASNNYDVARRWANRIAMMRRLCIQTVKKLTLQQL